MHDAEKLNEPQQRHLYASCQYIDGLLCDIEQIFSQENSLSPFPRYVIDLPPAAMKQLEDHVRRIREQLLQALAWQQIRPEEPEIPVSRAVLTNLSFIGIAIEELSPQYMRGCGAVPEGAIEGLNRVIRELRCAARGMERHLREQMADREAKSGDEGAERGNSQ